MNINYKEIAKLCHEANRGLCLAFGDDSQKPWEEATDEQRASCIEGVRHHIENPDLTPEQSHELWRQRKTALGWDYGEEKDELNQTHPCLVPYADLPIEQQAKDYVFAAIVRAATAQ